MNVAPLRATLLSLADDETEAALGAATARAAGMVSAAEADEARLVARARAEATAVADREALRTVGRARGEARAVVLGARRELYDEVRRRVSTEAPKLRDDPRYAALLERLQALASERLGGEATLEVDLPEGGVRGVAGSRRVDLSLPRIAERCLAELGPELEVLWQ
jgi:vacuolar-type H+-ATPase subunit E/Vma4